MKTLHPRKQVGWGGFGFPTLLFVAVLATGCGDGGETAEPTTTGAAASVVTSTTSEVASTTKGPAVEPAPRFFTPATPSGRYRMAVGASSTIQLPNDAPPPEVRGDAVLVIDVASVAPTGFRQWELRAVAVGETVISIDGDRPIVWMLIVVG